MKRSFLMAATLWAVAASIQAQNVVDAARYGASDIAGTARYRSMAGAFGALGGDPTCMNDNPAGIAIYRGTNTFSITPHYTVTNTESKGFAGAKQKDSNFAVSNLSAILSFKVDEEYLVNFNLGLGFTRRYENHNKILAGMESGNNTFADYLTNQANYYLNDALVPNSVFDPDNRTAQVPIMSIMAYDSYAIDDDPNNIHAVINPLKGTSPTQDLWMRESTREDHYNISGAMNFNDMLYVGATIAISDYNSILTSEYYEDYTDDIYLRYDNKFEMKGSGIGLNIGVLWNPVDNLKVGAALHTPTWYTFDGYYEGGMTTDMCDKDYWSTMYDSWRVDFLTPWEYQLSAAYIIGTKALVSVEYDLRDFTTCSYDNPQSYDYYYNYDEINDLTSTCLQKQHTFKAGAEYRLTDQVSLRGGYAYVTSPFSDETLSGQIDKRKQHFVYYDDTKPNSANLGTQYYITGGLGWRGKSWTIDCSYMYHHSKYHMIAHPGDYGNYYAVEVNQGKQDFDITFGYRF